MLNLKNFVYDENVLTAKFYSDFILLNLKVLSVRSLLCFKF